MDRIVIMQALEFTILFITSWRTQPRLRRLLLVARVITAGINEFINENVPATNLKR